MKRTLLGIALLAGPSCADSAGDPPPASVSGTGSSVTAPPVQSFLSRRLDQLTPAQSAALCREDVSQRDFCAGVGLAMPNREVCDAVIEQCRADAAGSDPSHSCEGFVLPSEDCGVSVERYLECVRAWEATQTCENAGHWIDTPAECADVVAECPRLASAFRVTKGKPPSCDPSTAVKPPRTEDDIHGFDGCRPIPARFVVLGDSVATCFLLDGSPSCGVNVIARHLKEGVAPDLKYEMHARGGAFVAELPSQAHEVEGGPGHVFVYIYMIGNDLISRKLDYPGWQAAFAETFDYFTDAARFPDGATFLLNTQYSPYDQCTDPLGGGHRITEEADRNLQEVNRRMFLEPAEARDDTVTIDQYPDFLGHGDNADIRGCPHCGADNTSWMNDGMHPNGIGYAHMASKWIIAIDRMLSPECAER